MEPRPFGDLLAAAVRKYLNDNNLTQRHLTGEILADIGQRFYDHFQAQQKQRKRKGDATPEDLAVYDAYPRKIGRVDALDAIRSARESHPREDFLGRVQEFNRSVARWPKNYRYKDGRDTVPYPASWFRSGRYLDDPKEWLPAGMFQREDDNPRLPVRADQPLDEPVPGWREKVRSHESLGIFVGRDWNTINDHYKRQIIQLTT